MVGKWHLGFCKSAYLPTHRYLILYHLILSYLILSYLILSYLPSHRGFNTFSGYYTGAEHYFSHVRDKGYDFRRNDNVDFGARGNYSTDLFNQEAVSILIFRSKYNHEQVRIVENEKGTKPFFLYLAYQVPKCQISKYQVLMYQIPGTRVTDTQVQGTIYKVSSNSMPSIQQHARC